MSNPGAKNNQGKAGTQGSAAGSDKKEVFHVYDKDAAKNMMLNIGDTLDKISKAQDRETARIFGGAAPLPSATSPTATQTGGQKNKGTTK